MDLTALATEVGGPEAGPLSPIGLGTRGGGSAAVRRVRAPGGIGEIRPDEMTVRCGAGLAVDELDAALAVHGQCVALPAGGTVGGALAAGRSDVRRLGRGPVRDAVLQARFVGASGEVVKAGGPTVKNVSGFDLCRLLVGSWGTLGVIGEVILRTRPRPAASRWFRTDQEPIALLGRLYRPASVLWDGRTTWVCLEGHPADVDDEADAVGLRDEVAGPPPLPTGGRWSVRPVDVTGLVGTGRFVAEVGVGVVHHEHPAPERTIDPAVQALHQRIRDELDPGRRFNPDVDVLGR